MQSRQNTPVIVPNQVISRQTLKMSKRLKWATSLSLWSAQTCLRFELGDMSPSSKAASCRRTPHRLAVSTRSKSETRPRFVAPQGRKPL